MKIYNMDIGWDSTSPDDAAITVLNAIYAMMDHDRGAKTPFDIILSDLIYDGADTIMVTAVQRNRVTGVYSVDERVSFTLQELFA